MYYKLATFIVGDVEYIVCSERPIINNDKSILWKDFNYKRDYIWKIEKKLYISDFKNKAPIDVINKEEIKLESLYKEADLLWKNICE
jgi:hypothetical protein